MCGTENYSRWRETSEHVQGVLTPSALRHVKGNELVPVKRQNSTGPSENSVRSEWFFLMLLRRTQYRFRSKSSLSRLHLHLFVATDHFRLTAPIIPLIILTSDPGLQTNGVPSPRRWYEMWSGQTEISGSYSHCRLLRANEAFMFNTLLTRDASCFTR